MGGEGQIGCLEFFFIRRTYDGIKTEMRTSEVASMRTRLINFNDTFNPSKPKSEGFCLDEAVDGWMDRWMGYGGAE